MKWLDIGDVADRAGVRPSTLRYYDDIGLISSVARKGLRRQFPPEVLLQLTLISMGKAAGFSLDEISQMFNSHGQPDLPRPVLRRKAAELDQQIGKLVALRDALRHVANCPAPSHMECPKFRRLVALAGRRGGATRRRPRRKAA